MSARLAAEAPAAAAAAAAAKDELLLNFAVPAKPVVHRKPVKIVTVPSRSGMLGLEKKSPAMLAELQAGVVRIDYLDNTSEEFFVPGGFAFMNKDNTLDVSSTEAVKLDQVDVEALKAANAEATKKRDSSAAGSRDRVEAQLALDVYKALSSAMKVNL